MGCGITYEVYVPSAVTHRAWTAWTRRRTAKLFREVYPNGPSCPITLLEHRIALVARSVTIPAIRPKAITPHRPLIVLPRRVNLHRMLAFQFPYLLDLQDFNDSFHCLPSRALPASLARPAAGVPLPPPGPHAPGVDSLATATPPLPIRTQHTPK